jgi:hypothetical protein
MEIPFVPFVPFLGWVGCTEGRQACRPPVQRWKELFGGFLLLVGGNFEGDQFGVLQTRAWFSTKARSATTSGLPIPSLMNASEIHSLHFCDDAGLAENDFLRDEVMCEAVFRQVEPDHPAQSGFQTGARRKLKEGVDFALPRSTYLQRLGVSVNA